MKSKTLSPAHDVCQIFKMNHEQTTIAIAQANAIETRRQYYYNHVLKPEGIPNPPYIQKPLSPSERQQGAMAFKERNKSLKFFIGLIQQAVVK